MNRAAVRLCPSGEYHLSIGLASPFQVVRPSWGITHSLRELSLPPACPSTMRLAQTAGRAARSARILLEAGPLCAEPLAVSLRSCSVLHIRSVLHHTHEPPCGLYPCGYHANLCVANPLKGAEGLPRRRNVRQADVTSLGHYVKPSWRFPRLKPRHDRTAWEGWQSSHEVRAYGARY